MARPAIAPPFLLALALALAAALAAAAPAPGAAPRHALAEDAAAADAPFRAVTPSGRLTERPVGQLPNYIPSAAPAAAAAAENSWDVDDDAPASAAAGEAAGGAGGGGLPIVDPPKRMAGYFKLNRTHDAHMFYLYYGSRGRRSDPVVLWMTGGPGCSSEIAVFYENGPYHLSKNLTLYDNPWGWDAAAHVIFVDQPINTGFSWSDDPRDSVSREGVVSADMLDFLQEFFEAHPEIADNDFYVSGESYAGHYAPAVANRIYRARELGEGAPINLQGVAIGNGLTMPAVQFGAYADFAQQNGIISERTRDSINWWMPPCRWGAGLCNSYKWGWLCGLTLQYCQLAIFNRVLMAKPGVNVYDIRKDCDGPLCYDFSDADAYLNSAAVRKALGVGDRSWQECNMLVHAGFWGDFMRDFGAKLVPLLEDGVRVMIYAGDQDLICNWLGNRRWVDALDWAGKEGWAQAQEQTWTVKGQPAGAVTSYDGLSFVKVFQAGHMVPMDQPQAALDMISRFTRGKPLADGGDAGEGAAAGAAGGAARPS
ncbi:serine carboxypeptidase-like enzyme [Raphidocelis subcapitata]|uniref:Carboxypeptidase n=1 Tax=Raphidocelis subcapitata TaxID=307507 RepID=A0A2V0P748_9CHLO|nr:serine carboxypeptidase-like enzyme [Raphidocelis subcapitata]|eukprot:GBF95389.1 serine carboxypeptidase-like enzyme [Raphidocelis subcapitata]